MSEGFFSLDDATRIARTVLKLENKTVSQITPNPNSNRRYVIGGSGTDIVPRGVLTSGSTIENGLVTVMVQRQSLDLTAGTFSNQGDPVKVYLPFYGDNVTTFEDAEYGIATGDVIDTLFQYNGQWVCPHCIHTSSHVVMTYESCEDIPGTEEM